MFCDVFVAYIDVTAPVKGGKYSVPTFAVGFCSEFSELQPMQNNTIKKL